MTKTETTSRKPRRMAREPEVNALSASAQPAAADSETGQSLATSNPNPVTATAAKPKSKQYQVIELLRRKEGALLTDLVEATGWLPHTARAALTGLKKKGHKIVATKLDKVTRYSIAGE